MANRHHKQSEQIARTLAHGAQSVSALERAIFWFQLLRNAEPSRALTLLQGSSHPTDFMNTQRLGKRGLDAARVAALVDVLLEASRAPNPPRPPAKISREIFHWHDWASFEIDLSAWVD